MIHMDRHDGGAELTVKGTYKELLVDVALLLAVIANGIGNDSETLTACDVVDVVAASARDVLADVADLNTLRM